MKTARFLAIAVLAVTSLLAAAHAQTMPAAPQEPNVQAAHVGNGSGLTTNDGTRPELSVGWYSVHPILCDIQTFARVITLTVYTREGYHFWTTDPVFQAGLDPACQSGNWVYFKVVDIYGDWYEFQTSPAR
jgi:hypothetical protein